MKRSTAILVFLLAMVICSAAAADTLFQSYRFQFNLPDGWVYGEASDSHIQCIRTDGDGWTETIDVYEPRFGLWPEDKNELPNYIEKGFDLDQNQKFEWIEVAGHETALVDVPGYENRDAYMTILPGSDERKVAFFVYSADIGHRNKEGFIAALDTFSERAKADLGFFNFGETDVKFIEYQTKNIMGGKRLYLSLGWRNNSDSISTFDSNVEVIVFQNGIELLEPVLAGKTDSAARVMPGKELDFVKAYDLREESGEVIVFIDKANDTNNEFGERTYKLNIH